MLCPTGKYQLRIIIKTPIKTCPQAISQIAVGVQLFTGIMIFSLVTFPCILITGIQCKMTIGKIGPPTYTEASKVHVVLEMIVQNKPCALPLIRKTAGWRKPVIEIGSPSYPSHIVTVEHCHRMLTVSHMGTYVASQSCLCMGIFICPQYCIMIIGIMITPGTVLIHKRKRLIFLYGIIQAKQSRTVSFKRNDIPDTIRIVH